MKLWKHQFTLQALNELGKSNMGAHLGIEFIAFSNSVLWASMPVDHRTKQPMGLLHGGASVVLAETLGSVASHLCLTDDQKFAVGIEINANHLKAVKSGSVYGKVSPIRVGKHIHVWNIQIFTPNREIVCISRLTTTVK